MIVTDTRVARFVSDAVGASFCPPYTCMGLERDGAIVAGAIFNQYEGFDVHVSIAGAGWTRAFIKAVGVYAFGQLGCLRMTATTEQQAVIDYAQRLGGQVEGRLRNHFGQGRDGVIIGILREEWKWGNFPINSAAERTSGASRMTGSTEERHENTKSA